MGSHPNTQVTTAWELTIIAFMLDCSRHPHWLFRRADQTIVAGLVAAALAATIGWWIAHGGWRRGLIEVDRAEQRTARFTVDINAADWPELMQLPGIGEKLARRVVEYRKTYGPFTSHDDLRHVRGIGAKVLEQIRPYLRPLPPK